MLGSIKDQKMKRFWYLAYVFISQNVINSFDLKLVQSGCTGAVPLKSKNKCFYLNWLTFIGLKMSMWTYNFIKIFVHKKCDAITE